MMLNKIRASNQKSKFYRVLRFLDGLMGALLSSHVIVVVYNLYLVTLVEKKLNEIEMIKYHNHFILGIQS
jgi:hypothetical protein